jgi:type II secretory pathway predicted ATPase ExeA
VVNATIPAPPVIRLAAIYRALGLSRDPFAIGTVAANPAPLGALLGARDGLLAWIGDRRAGSPSLALVIGASGSGRSTVVTDVLAQLQDDPATRPIVVTPDDGKMTDARLLRAIIHAFGGEPAGRTGLELVNEIRQLAIDGKVLPVIAIDDIEFTGSRLELLRSLLTPPVDAPDSYDLRILVTGTPDLGDRLARRRTLAHQIGHVVALVPLANDEIGQLVRWRIDVTRTDPIVDNGMSPRFADDAIAGIGEWSEGNARAVIQLAGECLLEAIARGRQDVDAVIVHEVARELTERARRRARAEAEAPYVLPAVQTKLDLPLFEPEPGTTGDGEPETGRKGQRR